jgi:predicted ATPase
VQRVLLLVDNYENVSDFINTSRNDDFIAIQSFLESLPDSATVILNSRNRSNLEGETIVNIEGLPVEDASKLFIRIAGNYLTTPILLEVQSKIEEICKMVDGHPLAIKLLAGAYKGGGVNRLIEMHDELYATIESKREPEERLRSISACFDYSYSRL